MRLQREESAPLWLSVSTQQAYLNGESIVEGLVEDVTQTKEGEQALRESSRLKDEFLAMLSHELRNPLNAISSAVQITRRQQTPEFAKWSREVIERQVKQLVRLIDDLLDVSRISRDKIQLQREDIDVRTVLEEAKNACKPLSTSVGISLLFQSARNL